MTWLPVIPEAIPSTLRARPYVLWRAEPVDGGKPRKVPYRVADPRRCASSADPATWAAFEDAVEAYSALVGVPDAIRGAVAGISVALTQDGGITCIDLDRVLINDQLDPRAAQIVATADSWAERSPSNSGVHIFVLGTVPRAIKGNQVEIYSTARFMALTGHHWPGTPEVLRDRQSYLDNFVALDRATVAPSQPWTGPSMPPPDDLAGALLARLERWGVPALRLKRWSDGFLVELARCPWADEHTTGPGGAAVMIRASGAYDFTCQHAHCAHRTWRDFRTAMEPR